MTFKPITERLVVPISSEERGFTLKKGSDKSENGLSFSDYDGNLSVG
jgi:hypothetical protein